MSTSSSSLPTSVAWLGYGGLIPFVGLAIAGLIAAPGWHGMITHALISYGAIILSFVGALHWGFATIRPELPAGLRTQLFVWSVIPSLLAWAALLLVDRSTLGATTLLIATFAAHLRQDVRLGQQPGMPEIPAWYLPLRARLTLVAILSLLVNAAV